MVFMNERRWRWLLALGVGWLALIVSGRAAADDRDRPGRDYVEIPFDGDLEAALKDHLLRTRGRQELQDLISQFRDSDIAEKLLRQLNSGDRGRLDQALDNPAM